MALPPTTRATTEFPEYTEKHKIILMEGEMVSMDGQLLKEVKTRARSRQAKTHRSF